MRQQLQDADKKALAKKMNIQQWDKVLILEDLSDT